jgi:ATP-dependent DNA helicase RecQ
MPTVRPPSATYGTLDLARARLLATFGYPDFRPPQIRAVQAVLSGRDSLVVLPTGGGKSLCYQVPALIREGLTVVISPLISLMKDQVDALQRKGVSAEFINSTLSVSDVADRMARARDGSLRMLYLAPERLEAGRTLQALADIGVSLLAVDEAHCISEWGHDFRPSYRRIGDIRERLGTPQTVALTATATPDVRLDIVRQLALQDAEVVVAGFDRINLTYHVTPVRSQSDKDMSAIALLRTTEAPAIVYAPTRKAVERVTAVLVRGKIRAVAYHAGLDTALRQRAQDAFMQQRARVIVATSAFGMGIDKPDVRLVVHHSMPGTLEAYYQEAGRAGRDGKESRCVLLYAYPDRFTHEFFIDGAHPDRATVQHTWRSLRAHANIDGVVAHSADALASLLASSLGDRKVSAALRVLVAAGACRTGAATTGRVWVRLLATPQRIAAELTGARAFDRGVLRAFWKVAGRTLEEGASIDLARLPRHLGGQAEIVPVLERLAAQQFVTWMRIGAGVRLDPRARHAKWPPVDWSAIDRRRASDLRRLDAMQQYAQTRYCRRAFVLRYFGDPEVRSQCAACDRCLGTTEVLPPASTKQSVRGRPRPL